MEQKRRLDTWVVFGTLALLLLAGLYTLLWPQGDFSESEKRYLNPAPSVPDLTRWQTDREMEAYLSDRIPLRRVLVGIDAEVQVLTGRRTQLAAWPVGENILEVPVEGKAAEVRKRLDSFRRLAEEAGKPWKLLVPPTHGSLLRPQMNGLMERLYQAEDELTDVLEAEEHLIPLKEAFEGFAEKEALYYRTDHHWTLQGAYLAYTRYCETVGREAKPLAFFRLQSFAGFMGTTASRSGLTWGQPDTLACAEPPGPVTMTIRETEESFGQLIFPDQAASWDGYAVYLNGNHGMLEIENPEAESGTLLIFKDSFANCLIPLLAANYRRIVAVDARYWKENFSHVIESVEADEILFCYSLDSLAHDTMLIRRAK